MTVDTVSATDALLGEIAAIEELLREYEDWRALVQLETLERQGSIPGGVDARSLKGLLVDKLSRNPLFQRRNALVHELTQARFEAERRAATLAAAPAAHETVVSEGPLDDLTLIRGIDARLERRLNRLGITAYRQIAGWVSDDVVYFAGTLGLGDQIAREMWIEQAALLMVEQRHRGGVQDATAAVAEAAASRPAPPPAQEPVSAPSDVAKLEVERPDGKSSELAPAKPAPVVERKDVPKSAAEVVPSKPEIESAHLKPLGAAKFAAAHAPQKIVPMAETHAVLSARAGAVAAAAAAGEVVTLVPLDASSPPQEARPEAVELDEAAADEAFAALVPPAPRAVRYYAGGVQEAHPWHASDTRTPMPKAASAYRSDFVPPAQAAPAPVGAGVAERAKQQPLVAEVTPPPAVVPAGPKEEPQRASEILTPTLPPLVLKPGSPSRAPEPPEFKARPPSPAPAPSPVAVREAVAATAHEPAKAAQAPRPAAMASEDLLLAAAASRSPANPGVSAPPPLPPAAPESQPQAWNAQAMPPALQDAVAAAAAAASHAAAPSGRASAPEDPADRFIGRSGSAEARVSIRRQEEMPQPTVVRAPGATEVHLGRSATRRTVDRFDGASYAAYHSSVEEASVEIRRPTDQPSATPPPARRVAPEAEAASASAVPAPRSPSQGDTTRQQEQTQTATGDTGKGGVGRFLKALTGQ